MVDSNYTRGEPIREPEWQKTAAAAAEEKRAAAKQTQAPRDTPCRLCGQAYTLRGVRVHEKKCAQKQKKMEVVSLSIIILYWEHTKVAL